MKIDTEIFYPMFRKAAALRNEMLAAGFNDNAGGIHCAERILGILGQRLKYQSLSHINNLREYPGVEFSVEARAAHERGEQVFVEHVSPVRDFTRQAIKLLDEGASDDELTNYIVKHFRLVLLTKEEMRHLNKINRSRMTPDRLGEAGIQVQRRAG